MFDRKYCIKIYRGGESTPLIEYTVDAQLVAVNGHILTIDGVRLMHSDNHYISVERI